MLAVTLVLLSSLVAAPSLAQASPSAAEYQIKAAYLVKFLGYIDWPSQAFGAGDAPLVIGVLGAGSLADELAQVASGRQVGGRALAVRKLRPGDAATELQVLFIARPENARLPTIAATARDRALLIVTESDEAMPQHSAINFVVVDDKVRFDVATHAFDKANLRVSARLLTVARKVMGTP
ncbi:YfiR family protein [Aquabacterium sp.]|uniref:YfiR family protein n=1 Tax=Aquabacterium sp. TaxID=1872578 RepID=UPI002C57BEB6|nr:YfiR family protein [Aquabacterium sp.]HSW05427.1 YfiR family protein [Aquabacterium sp.]